MRQFQNSNARLSALKAKCFEKFEKFEDAYQCYAKSNSLAKTSKEYSICDHEQYFQNLKDTLAELKSSSGKNKKSQPTSNPVFSLAFLVGFLDLELPY